MQIESRIDIEKVVAKIESYIFLIVTLTIIAGVVK
jgi:hypothetical protein